MVYIEHIITYIIFVKSLLKLSRASYTKKIKNSMKIYVLL